MQCSAGWLGMENQGLQEEAGVPGRRALLVLAACSAPHAPGAASAAASLPLSPRMNCPTSSSLSCHSVEYFQDAEDVLVPLPHHSQAREEKVTALTKLFFQKCLNINLIMAGGCSIQCSVLLHASAIYSTTFSCSA